MRDLNLSLIDFMGGVEGNLMEFLVLLTGSVYDHAGGHGYVFLARSELGVSFRVEGCCARLADAAPDLSIIRQQAKECGVTGFEFEMSECLKYRGNYLKQKS